MNKDIDNIIERPKVKNYCSNKDMKRELVKYKNTGVISEELGKMFINIATKYTNKGKFYSYTEKEDWVADAILRMVQKIDKFDPDHPRANPFAYFTQTVHNQVIGNIKDFKRRYNVKTELTELFMEEIERNPNIQPNKRMKENLHYL